jgi:hypothetical protein
VLEADGHAPLPHNLTPHSLRRPYIRLRLAVGDDIAVIARDAGHTDPRVTLAIYTSVVDDDPVQASASGPSCRAANGHKCAQRRISMPPRNRITAGCAAKSPHQQGFPEWA